MNQPILPTPHKFKLEALLANQHLPESDKPRVQEASNRYETWRSEMEAVERARTNTVKDLVDVTNRYKRFIELDLIFDSQNDFLYRQKGQLKLDNTILEEFLPQLIYSAIGSMDASFQLGPRKTFSGLSFLSSISAPGNGGGLSCRTKDQDFIVGKSLYLKSSFKEDFSDSTVIESNLGYVCAECKTNLDKTMFQEAVATSRDLKIAVPSSLYFLVCEFLDMAPRSITSTEIDDVLIVRKSKRMSSNIRQRYSNATARQKYRSEYIRFIDESKYYPEVFQRMIDKIKELIEDASPSSARVLDQGYF